MQLTSTTRRSILQRINSAWLYCISRNKKHSCSLNSQECYPCGQFHCTSSLPMSNGCLKCNDYNQISLLEAVRNNGTENLLTHETTLNSKKILGCCYLLYAYIGDIARLIQMCLLAITNTIYIFYTFLHNQLTFLLQIYNWSILCSKMLGVYRYGGKKITPSNIL